ncbi:MAG: YggS family pyridoxal phosphate-dependent enzyme [Saprospiraceae bacterium]|nr:YggS family pyridoxal phosphate-dependent enzyme [Saprospiraceae bacterium]
MYKELSDFCNTRSITLVAVTKTRPIASIQNLYDLGHREFGENRVQELSEKQEALPNDIRWHMIGHLQSNKVKYIASFVSMIHSGASYSLLKEINKRARQHERVIDVLLQVKIGKEEAKSGWDKNELLKALASDKLASLENINIRGVMGMATFTEDKSIVRSEFASLKSIFEQLKSTHFSARQDFDIISMGMSGDYKIAAEEGSTMVRIGSLLFQ